MASFARATYAFHDGSVVDLFVPTACTIALLQSAAVMNWFHEKDIKLASVSPSISTSLDIRKTLKALIMLEVQILVIVNSEEQRILAQFGLIHLDEFNEPGHISFLWHLVHVLKPTLDQTAYHDHVCDFVSLYNEMVGKLSSKRVGDIIAAYMTRINHAIDAYVSTIA